MYNKFLHIFKVLMLALLTVTPMSSNSVMGTASEWTLNYTGCLESPFQNQLSERSTWMKRGESCAVGEGGDGKQREAEGRPFTLGGRPPPGPLGRCQNFGAENNFCLPRPSQGRKRVKRRRQKRPKEGKLSLEMAYNLTVPRDFLKRIIGRTRGKAERRNSCHREALRLKIRVLGSSHKRRRHRKHRPKEEAEGPAPRSFVVLPSGEDTVTVRIPSLNLSFLLEGPSWKSVEQNASGGAVRTLVLTRKGDDAASKSVGGRPARPLPEGRLTHGTTKPVGSQLMSQIIQYLKASTSPDGSRTSCQSATVSEAVGKMKTDACTTTKVGQAVSIEAQTTKAQTGSTGYLSSTVKPRLCTINAGRIVAGSTVAANAKAAVITTESVILSTDSRQVIVEAVRLQPRDRSTEKKCIETEPETITIPKLSPVSSVPTIYTILEEAKTITTGTGPQRAESTAAITDSKTIIVTATSTSESRTLTQSNTNQSGQGEKVINISTLESKSVLAGSSTNAVQPETSSAFSSTSIKSLPITSGPKSDMTKSTTVTTIDTTQSSSIKCGGISSKPSRSEEGPMTTVGPKFTTSEPTEVTSELKPITKSVQPEPKSISLTEKVSTTDSGVVQTDSVSETSLPTISGECRGSRSSTAENVTESRPGPVATECLTLIPEALLPHLFPFLSERAAEVAVKGAREGSLPSTTFRSSFLAMIGPFDPKSSLRLSDIFSSATRPNPSKKKSSNSLSPTVSTFKRSYSNPNPYFQECRCQPLKTSND